MTIERKVELESGILNAIESDTLYDFVANNGWEMSNDTLKALALELIFALRHTTDYVTAFEDVKNELVDRYFFGEE